MNFRGNLQSLNKLDMLSFVFVFAVVIGGVVTSQIDRLLYEGTYAVEDGLVEWLSVLALSLGSITNFYRAYILKPFRSKRFIIMLTLLGGLFLFGFLEEISYGQRIIGFESPAFFKEHNTQMEFNLHNLKFGEARINKLIFGTFLGICIVIYFLIMPFIYCKKEQVKNFVDGLALPVPKWFHIGAYLLLALLAEFIASEKKGEILEFGGCWIFFLMTVRPYNREVFSRRSLNY